MSGTVRSGVAAAGGVAPKPSRSLAPVDPDRRQAELLAGDVVVEEALGGVQDPLARDVDRLEGELERGQARLVGPRVLGRDDPVERDAEAPVREREEVAVAVRDHAEPEALVEAAQRRRRVVERGPLADRAGEPVGIRVGGSKPSSAQSRRSDSARISR